MVRKQGCPVCTAGVLPPQLHKKKNMSNKQTVFEPLLPRNLTLSPVGVAARVGVHRATIFKWVKADIFPQPTIRAGRVVRWSVKAVDAWIEKGIQA